MNNIEFESDFAERERASKERIARLTGAHPALFEGKESPMGEWAYSVPEGWYDLIDSLCSGIEATLTRKQLEDLVVIQIKEKLGLVRYYYTTNDPKVRVVVNKLVEEATEQSGRTCLRCGSACEVKNLCGYIAPLCDFHAKVYVNEH